ncbi:alpha-L-fucosidase [Ligilactobacillus sp. WILCCON 0076]|uniref:alpha-L-fucosidase n=1 Tax=Ligilactobacillus ubinensis TaxID=2876789 RepID=A0A9X2FKT5_9LACO|nr:alpha-L-fucosidase [Ligilactobacillus ubinensis]MCP0887110.1 alpha-L-fucosidase [Ligilactobacillus ubinensis]
MKKIRQDIVENETTSNEAYGQLTKEQQEQLEWFQDQKLGVIFHWGLYSAAGIVESWQLSKEDSWARKKPWRKDLATLRHDYWQLAEQFNPQNFDADTWAKEAKKAGFKYALFTTKHHDGFNMFDTRQSDYSVTHYTRKDLFGEFANRFRKQDISVGAYYSKADWHSPYYWPPQSDPKGRYAAYDPKKQPELWHKFNNFVAQQLLEISQNYGKIDILWLDGGWVNKENHEFLDMDNIVANIREKQPKMLVVDRTIGGKYEDYVTPERKVPAIVPKKAWESNIPLAKNWGYVENDIYKPFSQILTTIVEIVSLGGNIILGVGPKPDGTLPKEALNIMGRLGNWLKIYGEGIYNTRAIPALKQTGWYFTVKQKTLYAFAKRDCFDLNNLDLTAITPWIVSKEIINQGVTASEILCAKINCTKNIRDIIK